ncbi:unnamed protein product [Blepharisma stoltei]|uniref:Uncharacterized protein n=1 Tax=Blepharisma stoltei TaxID=1481888 RepID=A0AAU9IBL3_9CILI|nr:unnamed protein product [Blepharisma stoltei]
MDSNINLTISPSLDCLYLASSFSSSIQPNFRKKLLEKALSKENLNLIPESPVNLPIAYFTDKSPKQINSGKISFTDTFIKKKPTQIVGEIESKPKFVPISPVLNKKKKQIRSQNSSCAKKTAKKLDKSTELVRCASTDIKKRKSALNAYIEEKINFLSKSRSMTPLGNTRLNNAISSLNAKKISEMKKVENTQDWNEISCSIIYLLCEIDPNIKITTKEHMREELSRYFRNPGHVVQVLRKLPELLVEKKISKKNIIKAHQHFLKADLSKLSKNTNTSEIIKLLGEIFSCCRDGEYFEPFKASFIDNPKELFLMNLEELCASPIKNREIEENSESTTTCKKITKKEESSVDKEKNIDNIAEITKEDADKQNFLIENIDNASISEIEGEDKPMLDDWFELEDLSQGETTDKKSEEEIANISSIGLQNISYGDFSLKSPYIYQEGSSFSSLERSEKFRSVPRLSNDPETSKFSLLNKFYQKSGYVTKEPPVLHDILMTPEVPPAISENDTPNFSAFPKDEQRNILNSSNKKPLISPLPLHCLNSPVIKPKSTQTTPRKSENHSKITQKLTELNRRVEEQKQFQIETRYNKMLEEKFQIFLEGKLREEKNKKISQFQKKHVWISEFKNTMDSISFGKHSDIKTVSKVKESFISHLSDRLYNRILAKAQKHIEEEQNHYDCALELKEAQAEIIKEKQKLLKLLSKYYK